MMSTVEEITECLICGSKLVYQQTAYEAKCAGCGLSFMTNCECQSGHYICDSCHSSKSLPIIYHFCLNTDKKNPLAIAEEIMMRPEIHMHGPENHVLIGSALLAAYKNSGGDIDLAEALNLMRQRGSQLPGSICGLWGNCGAGVSTGMFMSIITGTTPLSGASWRLCNLMTSESLKNISEPGGPRCCKRNGFLAIRTAVPFVAHHLGVSMELTSQPKCQFSPKNQQCLKERCPFFAG